MHIQLFEFKQCKSLITFFLIRYHYPSTEFLKSFQFYFVIFWGVWEPARAAYDKADKILAL